jgi:hypothetical protein
MNRLELEVEAIRLEAEGMREENEARNHDCIPKFGYDEFKALATKVRELIKSL